MAINISVDVRNKALKKAFITDALSNGNIKIYASDGIGKISPEILTSFSTPAYGNISLSGIVQIPIESGIVSELTLLGNSHIARIFLDASEEGDFTESSGTYQINSLVITLT